MLGLHLHIQKTGLNWLFREGPKGIPPVFIYHMITTDQSESFISSNMTIYGYEGPPALGQPNYAY